MQTQLDQELSNTITTLNNLRKVRVWFEYRKEAFDDETIKQVHTTLKADEDHAQNLLIETVSKKLGVADKH